MKEGKVRRERRRRGRRREEEERREKGGREGEEEKEFESPCWFGIGNIHHDFSIRFICLPSPVL